MERYIYTAMSGALHTLSAQRVHANNLANVGTSGFRADFERAAAYQVDGPGLASRYLSLPQAARTSAPITSATILNIGPPSLRILGFWLGSRGTDHAAVPDRVRT